LRPNNGLRGRTSRAADTERWVFEQGAAVQAV